jgi:Mrp family chromosome partitioning ATPase
VSHIYDALRRARGEKPRPGDPQPAEGTAPVEPIEPLEPEEGAAAVEPGAVPAPRAVVKGSLVGEPDFEFLRELDALRASVEVLLGRAPRRVVAFAGSRLGEGATTLALHFAYLVAQVIEKRVLLIDGDLSRETVGLSSAIGERAGLTELLREEVSLEAALLGTEHQHLHFLPAGQDTVGYIEAVNAPRLRPLLDQLGAAYDWIVCDLGPVLEHPETALLGAACDGVVLVVRAHQTRRALTQRALDALNVARCRVLGTVLNAQRESLPGFLRDRV